MYRPAFAAFAAAAALALAAPARAQDPAAPDDIPDAAELGPLPSPDEIMEMAPALDRMAGALLRMDVGPLLDAADPLAASPDYGRPGRTLGAIARRRDPDFERRLRSGIYEGGDRLGRMSAGLAAAAPVLAEQAHQLRHSLREAMRAYREAYRTAPAPAPAPRRDDGAFGLPDGD